MAPVVAAAGFGLLALAHSFLGERELLRPLFARPWELPIPRWAAERVFRFAWHLTSIAWLGLAALALGASMWTVLSVVGAVSGLIIFIMLRGHLAWPLFVVAAAAAAIAGGWLGGPGLVGVSFTAAAALCAVGVLHLLWAVGLRAGMDAALPTDDNGTLLLRPPSWLTAMVAFALLTTATAFAALASGVELFGLHAVVIAATVVFGVRAAGDGRYVGFTKTHRTSRFGRLDDLLYTPLSVLFALGGTAALLV